VDDNDEFDIEKIYNQNPESGSSDDEYEAIERSASNSHTISNETVQDKDILAVEIEE